MGKTKIEWSEVTWNPVTGCSKVSPGCDHCYAETMSRRLSNNPKYALATKADGTWSGVVSCHPEALEEPLRWKRPRRIFVCSMSDLFHSDIPWDFIVKVFDVMAATPWHTYQVLTKRPGRMAYFAEHIWPKQGGYWEPVEWTSPSRARVMDKWPGTAWPSNVWAGTSVETQRYAPRLELLARIPARVRFVSAEPLLGPLDLRDWLPGWCGAGSTHVPHSPAWAERYDIDWSPVNPVDWVIVGGESGPGARPMDLVWARDLVEQCRVAGVACFVKQLGRNPFDSELLWDSVDGRGHLLLDPKGGDPWEWSEDLRVREMPAEERR